MKGFDDPCVIRPAPMDLPDLEAELREHEARRPSNQDIKAITAWNVEKDRLSLWIQLSRASAVPLKVERIEIPEPIPPAPPAAEPEASMAWPAGKKMSEETKQKIREARQAKVVGVQVKVTGNPKGIARALDESRPQPTPACSEQQELQDLQVRVARLLAQALALPTAARAALVESAANLDALAHELAVFLASGRIEVPA